MKFEVSRASHWIDSRPQPCPEAVEETWTDEQGRNRREWQVEINSLEELLAFGQRHEHDLVVGTSSWRTSPHILIYDSYIE